MMIIALYLFGLCLCLEITVVITNTPVTRNEKQNKISTGW